MQRRSGSALVTWNSAGTRAPNTVGDFFESYVSTEAHVEDPTQRAERVVEWLVSERWIVPGLCDAALGTPGYRPGPAIPSVLKLGSDSRLMVAMTNGLVIHTSRRVFDAGQYGFTAGCSFCGAKIPDHDAIDLVGQWHSGVVDSVLACPGCLAQLTLFDLELDPLWGFSNFGITTWNWPPLPDEAHRQLESAAGVTLRRVSGKL